MQLSIGPENPKFFVFVLGVAVGAENHRSVRGQCQIQNCSKPIIDCLALHHRT
jgi:hypothetical protein